MGRCGTGEVVHIPAAIYGTRQADRIATILLSLLICGLVGADDAPRPPNIIIILADDLGVGDIGINGSPIRTPNIDRLAAEGVVLTNFYSSANVCTPSRAGIMTGRYSIRMGLAHQVIDPDSEKGLPESEITLAEELKNSGYHTALIGKWHLGHTPEHWPTNHGFDYYYGLPYSNDMTPLALYRASGKIEEPVDQNTLTRRYTEEAIAFIDDHAADFFFVFLSHAFPHYPLHASEQFRGKSSAGIYGDAIEEMDWSLGEIMAALDRNGLTDNTLIFFTSDNGAWFEGSNGEFRGTKGQSWEAGYRVPLISWWKKQIPAGTTSDAITMNIDLLPTILGAPGLEQTPGGELDGRNIWPVLLGSNQSPHEHLYLFNNEDVAGIRTQDWKYIVKGLLPP